MGRLVATDAGAHGVARPTNENDFAYVSLALGVANRFGEISPSRTGLPGGWRKLRREQLNQKLLISVWPKRRNEGVGIEVS